MCRAALSSKIADLWRPLLEQGMGTEVADGPAGCKQAGSWPPLQRQLAAVGIAVADMPQGRRPPLSGFVAAVAALLQAHSRDGLASGILQERLHVRASALVRCLLRLSSLSNWLCCIKSSRMVEYGLENAYGDMCSRFPQAVFRPHFTSA